MSEDEASQQTPRPGPATTEVLDEIRSLHKRMDDLHRLVAQRLATEGMSADDWLHDRAAALGRVPAWRRRTEGELRLPVTVTTAAAIALEMAVPRQLVLVRPTWILPAVQGALLITLFLVNPRRINRESRVLRGLSLTLAALLSLANGWSVVRLAIGITHGGMGQVGSGLLVNGALIWLTNVVVFCLWYWEYDRGGPVARALNLKNRLPDFQFPQMVSPPTMVAPDWEPAFLDYLYLAFTNATAFSPTDVMPMSRWAKAMMTGQAVISLLTGALIVARAVNILPSGG
jgi:uncharacterized membrane protein